MDEMSTEKNTTGLEIGVIGMTGRFPGAKDIHEFWDNLKNGVESYVTFSDEELEEAGVDPALIKNPEYIRGGQFIENNDCFDAGFFGYTSKEAEVMEPQTRVLHECAWEALEDAGYNPDSHQGSIGIYVGASSSSYWEALSLLSGKGDEMGVFETSQLNNKDFLGTRVAYKLNLKGPSFTLQSACSTSLLAIDLACRGLLTGQCEMALAGGISILLPPQLGYLYQEGFILSPDGHCRAFDAQAKGTMRGEGGGIVVLKLLEEAVLDGDHIYAVIKGTAVNCDGNRKVGYTAPSIKGQAEVIEAALHMAEAEPESISYIEAHGTGTTLGDPIELKALKQVFNTDKRGFCGLGSVKTNIGHLDAAAGVAGFIKTVLALKNKLIPPSLHFKSPNPEIDFENSPFYVNAKPKEWKSGKYPLRVGISSFGIGGTNAHVVLEEFSEVTRGITPLPEAHPSRKYQLILLSAKTPSALEKISVNLAKHLKKNPHISLSDVSYTLQVGRKALNYRKMLVCSDVDELITKLSPPGSKSVQTFCLKKEENQPAVFIFSGQGSQYVNMGLELYKAERLFREEMDRCFEILKTMMGYDLKEILYPQNSVSEVNRASSDSAAPLPGTVDFPLDGGTPDSREEGGVSVINQTETAQPALFVFEYALAKLLMTWGVNPYAMIGHSIGEYTAACLAGVFSLEDALNLVVWRGKLMQKIPSGAMLGVPLPEEELLPFLNEQISLAAVNSSSHCVVSGTNEAMDIFAADMKKMGYETSRLHTSHAFHSAMMDQILAEFEAHVKNIKFNKPQIPYISNVSGKWITPDDGNNPGYWKRHLRETVRFSRGLEELLKENNSVFIEVGPGKMLSTFIRQHRCKRDGHHTVNLIRHTKEDISDRYWLLNALGQIWLYGGRIDWEGFYADEKRRRVSLPTYPFERQRYWIDSDFSKIGLVKPSQETLLSKKKDISDWFYLPTWRRDLPPVENKKKGGSPGHRLWLILMDDDGAGKELVKRLEANGEDVICVEVGKEFREADDRRYIIDACKPGDYIALFKDLKDRGKVPGTIIHLFLLNLTGEHETGFDAESLELNFDRGFYSLIYLAQAIDKQHIAGKIRIEIVTNNMHDVTGEENLNPAKSILLGACKTIPQEYPNLNCRSIDIVFTGSGSLEEGHLLDRLITEFKSDITATVLAYRNNRRWVQVFEPLRLEKKIEGNLRLRQKGVYLVTGGIGRIGLIISGYLAAKVKAKLILISRSDFPPRDKWDRWLTDYREKNKESRAIKKIKEFENLGAEVLVFSADVSDENRMLEVITQSEKQFGPLNGVIHAAGVLGGESYRFINDIDKAVCKLQFQSKISGVLVLHELLKNKYLDFCLLTSSISAVLGGLTFIAYSAANIFMDAFAIWHHKLNPSQPWISVNWDGWRGDGEAVNDNSIIGKKLFDLAMKPEEGIEAFERILSCEGLTHVINSTGDLHARIREWINLESIQKKENIPDKESSTALYSRPNLTNPYVSPNTQVETDLCEIWKGLFGFQQVGIHDNFFELGGDSLKVITVTSRIHKELNVRIPMDDFFINPTIEGLAGYIKANEMKNIYHAINPVEKKEYYPLSSAQKRMYVVQQINLELISYNISEVLILEGEVIREKVEEIFKKIVKSHESLRTSFEIIDGEPMQRIHDEIVFKMEYHETSEEKIPEVVENFIRPFNLAKAPLMRAGLIKTGKESQLLMTDIHHIISDGVSINILSKNFLTLYRGEELPGLNLQYKDFSEWQNNLVISVEIERQMNYWLNTIAGEIPILNLPTDFPRPTVQDFEGDYLYFYIDEELFKKLDHLTKETGTTLYMVLLAVLNLLLSKYTGQEDIVIGSPISGRTHADLENIIGMFVGQLALRNRPSRDKTFREFLAEVKENALRAFENQDYQFDVLVNRLGLMGNYSRHPLFDVVFAFQDWKIPDHDIPGLKLKQYVYKEKTSKTDLRFGAEMVNAVINIRLTYATSLFKRTTIEKMAKRYIKILRQVLEMPDIELAEITLEHGLVMAHPILLDEKNSNFEF